MVSMNLRTPGNWFSTILIVTGIWIMRSRSWTNIKTYGRKMEKKKFFWISVRPSCVDWPLTMMGIWEFTVFKEVWMGGLLSGWFQVFCQRKIHKTHVTGKFIWRKHQFRLGYINFSGRVDQNNLGVQDLTIGHSKCRFPSFSSKSFRSSSLLMRVESVSRMVWLVNGSLPKDVNFSKNKKSTFHP